MQNTFLIPDAYVFSHLNLQRCTSNACGCSAESLRTKQGQSDRSIDLTQACDRTWQATRVGSAARVARLAQAANRYNRLDGFMTYPIVGSVIA